MTKAEREQLMRDLREFNKLLGELQRVSTRIELAADNALRAFKEGGTCESI